MKKLIIAKRTSQFIFSGLFLYVLWSTTYPLTGFLSSEVLFKTDPLVMILTSVSTRNVLPGIAWSLLMLGLTAVLGRFFCGWVCPLGTVIDIASAEKKNRGLPDRANARLRRIKFWILGASVVAALAGFQVAWILDPLVIAGRFVSLNLIPTVTFALNAAFSALIPGVNFYAPVYDFYRWLQSSLLGVQVRYVAHSAFIFAVLLAIVIAADLLKRSWCRALCPLGALYAFVGGISGLRRIVSRCGHCGKCTSICRMGAIKDDTAYVRSECILCMDCVYDCPRKGTRFGFGKEKTPAPDRRGGLTRRQFLIWGAVSLPSLLGFRVVYPAARRSGPPRVIRPPASLKESEFLNRCVRCGNCMKVCITNGLQPAALQAGVSGVWTPQLVPEIGYCEYHCTLCGSVCPTGAIPKLTEKEKLVTRLGIARIDRAVCLPWHKKKECVVCEEHCPTANKAIQLKEVEIDGTVLLRPYINERLCIGCGICQTKCPVRPQRAVKVHPVRVTHGV
jgi:polyferredoxin/formate hydrogenlyase subunit 6/NADH:ubiquinone oxidoreductase subunit I